MLAARIINTFSSLARQNAQLFCKTKAPGNPKMFVKNENLTFEDAHHKLTTYFFLPELKNKSNNTYEINKYSNVLSFVWSPKQSQPIDPQGKDAEMGKQAQTKLSFSFRYPELQSLLQVGPNSGLTSTIQHKKQTNIIEQHQTLTLIDNPQKKVIHYNYRNHSKKVPDSTETKSWLDFEFAYSKHRIFQILLRKSLFELSGMGIIYELKKEIELSSAQNESIRRREQIEKEKAEFYKHR